VIAAWWQGLQQRERQLLTVGATLLALFLFWLLIWHPLANGRASLESAVIRQREALATMRAQALEVQRLRAAGVSGRAERQGKSLLALADATARGAGLTGALKRVEPVSAKSVRVTLELANFDALIGWMESLARDFTVQATDFSADRADGVGLVNARITLEEQ
jgi:general secretion pathway protein M